MTRSEISSMCATGHLNEIVAELVMGWGKWDICHTGWQMYREGWNWTIAGDTAPHFEEWHPSTEIESAWKVVEKLAAEQCPMTIRYEPRSFSYNGSVENDPEKRWVCSVIYGKEPLGRQLVIASAPTAPLAISRAALMSVLPREYIFPPTPASQPATP